LIPAAGQASRLNRLPFSKELYPVDVSDDPDMQVPKPVIEFLLENMRASGIGRAYVVVRDGKWDIPAHLEDGSPFGMTLGYLMLGLPYGVPYTLDQAYEHVRDCVVALGFPDIVLRRPDAFARCLERLGESGADVVLGGFPADHPPGVDMIEFGADGAVRKLIVKPPSSNLTHTWGLGVWRPSLSDFMHELLLARSDPSHAEPELHVAHVLNEAIAAGLDVRIEMVSDQPYVDIGTPGGLARFARDRNRHLSED
jgi:glucose-1-phosphate thymidylyltransferase